MAPPLQTLGAEIPLACSDLPLALLQNRTNHWSKHRGEERLIGIHFRTGNYSARWVDPSRHEVGQLVAFLECARQVEKMLQFPANKTRWFLAADAPLEIPEEFASKVFGPADPETNELNNIVHLDRSQIGDLVVGLVDAWAQWLLLASSDAVILSESGFGATAAEIGHTEAFLGATCVRADVQWT
eukprot:GEMP01057596.1.p1 GENE.GEMP01057596.1~~GEMP01057596.1.p1  ORF type:complete len:185 (+),score=41.08 GEMP01057596.1:174-728(+)